MKKFDRGGDVYGAIDVIGQRPGSGNFGGGIFGGYAGSPSGWSVPTAGTGRPLTEEEADAIARRFYENWDPYGGQSIVDREAELKAILAEQGYVEDQSSPYGELPVFLTDVIGEYPTIGGNILPGDQGTATSVSATETPDRGILDVIGQTSGNVVGAVKNTADALLSQIKEFLPFYDQSQVVLNPTTGQATIVFGPPPAGQPVIQAGNLPRSNTNVGITTGIPILDQAINSVLRKPGGLESGSIRDEVIKVISEQAGLDPATTAGILGEDLDTILSTANAEVANTASRLGVDLSGPKKEDDAVDTVIRGPSQVGEMGPTLKELMSETATDGEDKTVVTGVGDTGGGKSVVTGVGDTGGDKTVITGEDKDVADLGTRVTLTPADLGEGPQKAVSSTVETPTTKGVGTASLLSPSYGQGIRGMKTEKAGIAPLEDTFDISDLSLAEILRLLTAADDNTQRSPYYGGGSVNSANSLDEIIRLLRG